MPSVRRKIIAANWKMNKLPGEAAVLIQEIIDGLENPRIKEPQIILFPPYILIKECVDAIGGHYPILVGSQNVHQEAEGAYTGEISAPMLRNLYCRYVILGHSERRQYFNETDALINAKAQAAFASEIHPLICVGETLAQREAGNMERVVGTQLQGSLKNFTDQQWADTIIAYEPVWAIGTGKTATPEQAQQMHLFIRTQIAQMASPAIAEKMHILYGGSVKAENAQEILSQPDVDGALVGGASLEARSFIKIIQAAMPETATTNSN